MITLKVYVFVVVVLCIHEVSSLAENLIEDWSFEEYRSNTWNITERTTGATRYRTAPLRDCLTRHTGLCSVVFGTFNHVEALFMSQYVNVVDRLGEDSAGAIRLEFWTNGRHSAQLRAHLDIAYADRSRHMSAVVSPAEYIGANTLKGLELSGRNVHEIMHYCTRLRSYTGHNAALCSRQQARSRLFHLY